MIVILGGDSGTSQVKQLFSYDANGDVVSVNYNGTEYFYLRNGQNDIVGLMDGSGNRVVEYTYDAWGKLISTTGTLATSLGADNPFRYRGYRRGCIMYTAVITILRSVGGLMRMMLQILVQMVPY